MSSHLLPPTGNAAPTQNQLLVETLTDRILAMRKQELQYNIRHYVRNITGGSDADITENNWREKIVTWTFSVVDFFDLAREVVAFSLSLFDRFLATRGNRCNGNSALLISLTTLHIAIKLNERRRIKLSTLANLGRGQFGPKHIEEMEWIILTTLGWRVHPPTAVAFVSNLLSFLPEVHPAIKNDIYELAKYLTELSVCDAFFVDIPASTIAYASILNVMEELRQFGRSYLPSRVRDRFVRNLSEKVYMDHTSVDVVHARHELRTKYAASLRAYAQEESVVFGQQAHQQRGTADDASRTSSKGSIKGGLTGRSRSRSGSYDSAGSWSRYSASPQVHRRSRHRARSPSCSTLRNRASTSPSVT
eukprot:CAMPEP_0113529786 /NCGR_PEP_ID=MMETSP0015_2-20120614/2582_1 /TAXON_ID=2838 /ORGANISM="Odontella" /LENGTH=361 /DNA_ID=CAMNT_0000428445 /DNA_START=118 /DNA_END=1200 /DNA_ORIENTATION=+ /assembly_acc=CAM_ASM_000160